MPEKGIAVHGVCSFSLRPAFTPFTLFLFETDPVDAKEEFLLAESLDAGEGRVVPARQAALHLVQVPATLLPSIERELQIARCARFHGTLFLSLFAAVHIDRLQPAKQGATSPGYCNILTIVGSGQCPQGLV